MFSSRECREKGEGAWRRALRSQGEIGSNLFALANSQTFYSESLFPISLPCPLSKKEAALVRSAARVHCVQGDYAGSDLKGLFAARNSSMEKL